MLTFCREVVQTLQTFLTSPSYVLQRLKQLSGSVSGESAKAVAEKKAALDAKFVELRSEAIDNVCRQDDWLCVTVVVCFM